MAGKDGTNAKNVVAPTQAERQQSLNQAVGSNADLAGLMAQYGNGDLSLQDALSKGQGIAGGITDPTVANYNKAEQDAINAAGAKFDADNPDAVKAMHAVGVDSPDRKKAMDDAKAKYESENARPTDSNANGIAAFQHMLATDPLTAQKFAAGQLQNDPVMGKYFGQGGMQDRVLGAQAGLDKNLADDRDALMGKGEQYGLTDQDLKAYGQASGNAARLFGSQESGLSQSLADRGLGAGASGSAGAQFSGLQGNKNEMLAGIQNQIAQNRINTAQSLAQFRTQADAEQAARNQQVAMQLGQFGASDENAIRQMNQGSVNSANVQLNTTAGQERGAQQDLQNQANENFAQQLATRKKSFGEMLGDAVSGSVSSAAGGLAGNAVSDLDPVNGANRIGGAYSKFAGGGTGGGGMGGLAAML